MFYFMIFILSIATFLDLNKKKNLRIFYILLLMIILIDGLRTETATDWGTYKYFFDLSIFNRFEIGYEVYILAVKKIWDNYQFFVFLHAVIVDFLIYYSIFCISQYSFISVLLSYSLIESILGSNRQLLAMGVVFFSFYLIYEKKKIFSGTIGLFISMLIHTSAIIIYPFFILKKLIFNKKTNLIFILFFLLILKIFLKNIIIVLLNNKELLERVLPYLRQSFPYYKLLINFFKYGILIFIAKILSKKNNMNKKNNIFFLGCIYSLMITIFFWGTFQIVAGRGNYYTILLFIFTYIGHNIKLNNNKKIKLWLIISIILYSFIVFERGISKYKDLFVPYKGLIYNKNYIRERIY